MDAFRYRQHRLLAEDVALADIARQFGTPTWVYSKSAIVAAWDEFAAAAAGRRVLLCYALKANSNLAIIDLLARRGAGFDIVSGGELERVLAAGGDASRVVFSGVGKQREEMKLALEAGVRCFNVESESELLRLDEVARATGRHAPVSLRVNPDVDAGTHPYISTGLRENKFGIAHDEALRVYRLAASLPGIEVTGRRTPAPGTTNSGRTRSEGASVVSRTRSRSAAVRRSRRGRWEPAENTSASRAPAR